MKLIMEKWRQIIISEELSDIKDDAGEIKDLIKRIPQEKDKSKIENTLQALLKDEDIIKALEAIEEFEEEVETQGQQNEGILDYISDKSMDAMEWAKSDKGKKLINKGGKLLALALVAKALYGLTKNDPNSLQALEAARDVITAGGEDVIEIIMGATELVSESDKTQYMVKVGDLEKRMSDLEKDINKKKKQYSDFSYRTKKITGKEQ